MRLKYFLSACFLFIVMLVVPVVQVPAQSSLLLHWGFDEASDTVADLSGKGRSGTVHGASYTDGKYGKALSFDGSDQWVEESGAGAYLNGLDTLSISVWVKSNTASTDAGFLKGHTSDQDDESSLAIRYESGPVSGGLHNLLKAGLNTTQAASHVLSTENSTDTAWQHVVISWRQGDSISLYINGVHNPLAYPGSNLGGVIDGVETLILGKGPQDLNSSWDGLIDELRIYSTDVSDEQVLRLMNNLPLHADEQADVTYNSLKNKPDGGYYMLDADSAALNFTWLEKYTAHSLHYKIYDFSRNIVLSAASQPLVASYGQNFFSLDVSALDAGRYTLEVTGQKGNKKYLNFKINPL